MILQIFNKYRRNILFTYSIFLIEFLIFSTYPYLFGKAIDGLVAHGYKNYIIYIILVIVGSAIGCFRRCIDTRIFGVVLYQLMGETVVKLTKQEVKSPRIAARVGLVGHYIQFIESHISSIISSIINIAISFVMINAQSPHSVYYIAIISILSTFCFYYISKKIQNIGFMSQDIREEISLKIIGGNVENIANEYETARQYQVNQSDWEAVIWTIINLSTLLAESIVAFNIIQHNGSIGTIMASVAYTNRIFGRVGVIGSFFNQIALIKVTDRILEK